MLAFKKWETNFRALLETGSQVNILTTSTGTVLCIYGQLSVLRNVGQSHGRVGFGDRKGPRLSVPWSQEVQTQERRQHQLWLRNWKRNKESTNHPCNSQKGSLHFPTSPAEEIMQFPESLGCSSDVHVLNSLVRIPTVGKGVLVPQSDSLKKIQQKEKEI